MNSISLRILAALVLGAVSLQAQQPPATASLAGRVTVLANGQPVPVRRARVSIVAADRSVVTDTDSEGRFRFDNLVPARVRVAVEKPGFVPSGASQVTLTAGATMTADVRVERAGAIEGRVVTDTGEPGAMIVSAVQLQDGPNGRTPVSVRQARTDDLGRFRLHTLPAGDFFLEAAPDPASVARRPPGTETPVPARTYFPAAARMEDGRSVTVTLGQEVNGIELIVPSAAPDPNRSSPPSPPRPAAMQGLGHLAGTVTAARSGRPIAGAVVRIVRWTGFTGAQTYVSTDPQGRYLFANLSAGRYQINVSADGYVPLEYGQRTPVESGRPIELVEAQQLDKLDIALPRTSAIEGRIVDEFGDPAPGIVVQVARVEFAAGRTRLMPTGGAVRPQPTDDLGQFRVPALAPGDYYVIALSGPFANEDRAGFAPTFFPGTSVPRDATATHVDVDRDVTGMNLQMVAAPSFLLSGRVVDSTGSAVKTGRLMLLQTYDGDVRAMIMATGAMNADGTFTIRNVPVGTYALQTLQGPPPGSAGFAGFAGVPLNVNGDLRDLIITVTSGAAARGRISFEGVAPVPAASQVRVLPRPIDFVSGPAVGAGFPPTRISEDWSFELPRNFGRVVLRVDAPAPWGLKSIHANGVDVTDAALDFSGKDVEGLEVVLTQLNALQGTVSERGSPMREYTVIVFVDDPTKWAFPSRHVAMARPNQDGKFSVIALPAGSYQAIAVPSVGSEWQNPEFLAGIRPRATGVVLGGGQTQTIDLPLVR